jgi:hypothetical protein
MENKKQMLGDIFSLFVGKDQYRPELHKPFQINGKLYATDAYALIRTDIAFVKSAITNTVFILNNIKMQTTNGINLIGVLSTITGKFKHDEMDRT